jgi:hypothetical protein
MPLRVEEGPQIQFWSENLVQAAKVRGLPVLEDVDIRARALEAVEWQDHALANHLALPAFQA